MGNGRRRGGAGRGIAAAILWASTGAVGCADPCFDDGLNQGGCPERESDPTRGPTEGATETEGTAEGTAGTIDDTGLPSGDGGDMCPELEEVLLPQIPTFQLVVDQSGSMDEDFDGGDTRWEAMERTLVGPDGVVTLLQSNIRFGISLYNNPGMGTCPSVTTLAPQLDAADEIAALLAGEQPGGDTPTGESLEQITSDLLGDAWDGDKVMVLTTDGEPDTCAVPEPSPGAQVDMVRGVAVDAVTAAYGEGIRTFVISVGIDIAQEHLQDLANAGIGQQAGDPDAPFWVANDTASLVAAFNDIVAGLRPCEFSLNAPVMEGQEGQCSVTVNDVEFPFGDADGWVLPDPSTLGLQGAACDAIQQGVVSVRLECSCGA
ncbi:MAG: VWA domain-containing protein [Myxococcales bacterium]|nr:VWA domain-containing protein [Myxococcales bacterium]